MSSKPVIACGYATLESEDSGLEKIGRWSLEWTVTLRIIPELEMTDLTGLLGLGICDRIITGFGSGDDVSGFLAMD